MSFEAITTISDAENRARQIKADAQAAAAAAVEAAQSEGKAVIKAKTNLDRAASLIVERIVNG